MVASPQDAVSHSPPESSNVSKSSFKLDDQLVDKTEPVAPLGVPVDYQASVVLQLLTFGRYGQGHTKVDLDATATQPSVFDGPDAKQYTPKADYENIHRFNTSLRWTWREEKKIVRRQDLLTLSWCCLMFLALDIDRGNMTNATADGILDDLGMTTDDYNLGNTLSKLGFLIAELPSQLVSKRVGPDRWIPSQIVIFSIISGAQFWLKGRASFLACRFLIAFFQGGFIPDTVLYLSYWYTKTELPIRLAFFWSMNYTADCICTFLAAGLLKMRGVGGYAGWQWMFILEGIFTLLIGIASFFMMPSSPTHTRTWFRPDGWYSIREEAIITNRILRDDPTKGDMHNREMLTPKMLWKSLCDFDLWPLYIIGLLFGIPGYPISNYLQLSFKHLGFSTIEANLLAIPHYFISVILLLVITLISELVNERTFVSMAENIWFLPCFIALYVMPQPIGGWQYFAIATVLLGFPYVHAIQVSWASRNSGSVRTRTVSASVYNMFVQASGIIGANIYVKSDAPAYKEGNKTLIAIICLNLTVIYPATKAYYILRNQYKTRKWNAMTPEEKSTYLTTTTDEGSKRLDFIFAH